ATNIVMSLLVPILWRFLPGGEAAASRAGTLLKLRLLPLVSALFVAWLSMLSFLRFEPRTSNETTGFLLGLLAAAALLLAVSSAGRTMRVHWRGRRVLRNWMASARQISVPGATIPSYVVDATFPIVAVAGIIRPVLIVARSVLMSCSEEHLSAIIAHEQAHL